MAWSDAHTPNLEFKMFPAIIGTYYKGCNQKTTIFENEQMMNS